MGTVTIYLTDKIDQFLYSKAVEEGVSKSKFCQSVLFDWFKTQTPNDSAIRERLEFIDGQIALNPNDALRNSLLSELSEWRTKAKRETTKQDVQRRIDTLDPPKNTKWSAEQEIADYHREKGIKKHKEVSP